MGGPLYGGIPQHQPDPDPTSHHPAGPASEAEQIAADKTLLYRFERLTSAGLTAAQARVIALRRDVDLHTVERLIDRGCAPHLAFDIVT